MQKKPRGTLSAMILPATTGIALLAGAAGDLAAQEEQVVNIYSARHYQTDEALYENFTKQTGIEINRIEGNGDALAERIKAEGENSPADVFITVDAGRLWRADQLGLFLPVHSKLLEERIPANLRHPDGHWFGFSTRARVIFYNKDMVDPSEVGSYEDLADPKWDDMICMRSSANVYNLSLMASLIAHDGEEKALEWAKGVVANFARDPQGGDIDQLRAVAAGECGLTIANTYYFVRLAQSDDPEDQEVADKVGVIFPNQDGRGTHVNISGAGALKYAPHKEAAIKFLEYLASDEAQRYFAHGNNEYPTVEGVAASDALELLGDFKADDLNVAVLGENQPLAQKLFDRVGWK